LAVVHATADVAVVHATQELATSVETNSALPVSGQLANGQVSSMNTGQTEGDLTLTALRRAHIPEATAPPCSRGNAARIGSTY
jgi:hypothetical protein